MSDLIKGYDPSTGQLLPIVVDSNGVLAISATISGADGAIQDGVTGSIKATVKDLPNSNPLTVAVTDANGDQIVSFGGTGGGTEEQLDYDTGAGTVSLSVIGLALPGAGGPVAGGTTTHPLIISGTQANNAAITANPTLVGAEARQDLSGTLATAGNIVRIVADRNGRTITIKPKLLMISSNGTPITTATTTDVLGLPGAATHYKIYRLHASNDGATATWVYWVDSTGTTKLFPTFLPQNGVVSLAIDGEWELTSNKKLQIVTSAAGSVEWHVSYEIIGD
jgi:hypothetical protein